MNTHGLSRRGFLRGAGLGTALLLGSGLARGPRGLAWATPRAEAQMGDFMPDVVIDLTARNDKTVQILSGATNVWGYEGELMEMTPNSGVTLTPIPGSYLGPIIRAPKGTKVRINFHNRLGEDSVIHPHGLRVPEECDGSPMQQIPTGADKVYDFTVVDRASPAWFHPHPHMRTAEQVYMGLAGLFYVTDAEEQAAVPGAATGANDIPVVIQDRKFDSNNQFLYQPNNMWGMLGDRILVNGKVNAGFSLEPRAYRLRLLNGSNARTYKIAWSNGMALKVIGTDGGLLPAVETHPYVMLMPGERVDLWVDFSSLAAKSVILRSLSFDPMGMMGGGGMTGGGMGATTDGAGAMSDGMASSDSMAGPDGMGGPGGGGGGGMGGMGLANGAALDILTVTVGQTASVKPVLGPLPGKLSETFNARNVSNWKKPTPFTLEMARMVWTINHRVYEMEGVADDEMVTVDKPIAWEWVNNSPIPHPMHIHAVQFQVVQRTSPGTSSYATVNQGFVDSGWKDTVLVWPGERVKIAMRFGPYDGMYMYHCHILEHEDMTMMRNLMVMPAKMPM